MSTLLRRLALLLLAMAAPALAAAPKPAPAASSRDWSQVAERLPSGAFLQGNPAAKVKLVEFLSLTCPHCALFEKDAHQPLTEKYVRTGLVSYEVRIALRDPFDLVAATLARCAGPRPFFAVKPELYAAQEDWIDKGQKWGATAPALDLMTEANAAKAIAAGAGLDSFFLQHGLPQARIDACLADTDEQHKLSAAAQQIWQPGFPGTPTFLINGKQYGDVRSWADLEPKLRSAAGLH